MSSGSPTSSRIASRTPRREADAGQRLVGRPAMALHCTECGFVNAEGANYCQRCGGLLARPENAGETVTATYRIDEAGELVPIEIDEVNAHGPGLVLPP